MAVENWDFDLVHSSVGFWVRHLMVSKVHGRFNKWSGSLAIDEANPASSKVAVKIETASVDTREEKRDGHLRSADFFESDKFPTMDFTSTSVSKSGDAEYTVVGDLTIHGVTKPVTLKVESAGRTKDPWGGERAGFSATTSIHRKDFGLHYNQVLEAGGVVIGDKIEIAIEIEGVKAKASQAA